MQIRSNFVICARNIVSEQRCSYFGSEPRETTYLEVPFTAEPHPRKHQLKKETWLKRLMDRAGTGDILIFAHGYNNSPMDAMIRHDQLQNILFRNGFDGVIVSFDWPSFHSAMNYEEAIEDAYTTATKLCEDGIAIIKSACKPPSKIHLLGHSSGCYVINQAFVQISDANTEIDCDVDQIALMAADLQIKYLEKLTPLVSVAKRITNYQAPYDGVLFVGDMFYQREDYRVGLWGPSKKVAPNVVNVNTLQHWDMLEKEDDSDAATEGSHSWYFEDNTLGDDLVQVLEGKERHFHTRTHDFGELFLTKKRQT